MYFLRIKKLREELVDRPLTDSESLKYFLVFILLGLSIHLFPLDIIKIVSLPPAKGSPLFGYYIKKAIYLFIYLIGIYYCYRMNGGIRGNYFLQRFISIGLVVNIRFLLLTLILSIMFFIGLWLSIYFSLFGLTRTPTNVSSNIPSPSGGYFQSWWKQYLEIGMILLEVLILWRIGSHIKKVAQEALYKTNTRPRIENEI